MSEEYQKVEVVEGPIKTIFIFNNGMCAVFNDRGEQMAQLQGSFKEKEQAICLEIGNQSFLPEIRGQS